MVRAIVGWLGIALVGVGYLQAASQQSSTSAGPSSSSHRAVLNRYCVTCHNERLKTAGLTLDQLDVENVSTSAEVWEKVIRKLRTGAMPPAGVPRPDQGTYASLAAHLEAELDRAATANPNPGRPVAHRLNRAEYRNAIRDLFAIDIDSASLLPADDSGYGFDNIGDVLSVSPLLLERYLSAARKITRLAIGSPVSRPDFSTYDISSFLLQDDRMSEDLPLGSRGGIAIRHFFPLDGEYVITIRLRRTSSGTRIAGLDKPHQLDVRLDGERIERFTFGGHSEDQSDSYGAAPRKEDGRPEDAGLEVSIPLNAGTRLVTVAFVKEASDLPEDVIQPGLWDRERDRAAVGSVSISGPYNAKGQGDTASRRKIFVCRPSGIEDEEPCAAKILSTLARRAYRRPVADADIQSLLSVYRTGKSNGGFEAGIEMALQAMLVSPKFLFRIEPDPAHVPPNTVYGTTDLELASRLSFFLWSSIPDAELLDLAERSELKDPATLEQQVRRMLADFRSKALISNFAGQWLYLRNVHSAAPDLGEFPDFDDNLRAAFQQETELFLESTLREDRSVLELLDANYSFLNERLSRHYGIPNIYGSHFRRVTLSDGKRRGLLGQGSILMVTSYGNRTSPTLRGKWLLSNILGAPPPPPPPNIPPLEEKNEDGLLLSVRQQMERHRANPVCASCHAQMDPLGFALENFDAVGKWRTNEAGIPVDSSGVLPDGTKFKGPAGLRTVLLSKPEQFVTAVTEKLLTYALGRGLEYYDGPAVRGVVRGAAESDYRWSSIILGIVKSTPFQMRRSREP